MLINKDQLIHVEVMMNLRKVGPSNSTVRLKRAFTAKKRVFSSSTILKMTL